jgi:hypothetical protein
VDILGYSLPSVLDEKQSKIDEISTYKRYEYLGGYSGGILWRETEQGYQYRGHLSGYSRVFFPICGSQGEKQSKDISIEGTHVWISWDIPCPTLLFNLFMF